MLFRSGWYRSRPRTSLRSPGAADHTSESGAAAAAPAPTRIQEVATAASRRRQRSVRLRVALLTNVAGKISKKNCRKRTFEKEIGEAPPSRLERVGLLAERVARLRPRTHAREISAIKVYAALNR